MSQQTGKVEAMPAGENLVAGEAAGEGYQGKPLLRPRHWKLWRIVLEMCLAWCIFTRSPCENTSCLWKETGLWRQSKAHGNAAYRPGRKLHV